MDFTIEEGPCNRPISRHRAVPPSGTGPGTSLARLLLSEIQRSGEHSVNAQGRPQRRPHC